MRSGKANSGAGCSEWDTRGWAALGVLLWDVLRGEADILFDVPLSLILVIACVACNEVVSLKSTLISSLSFIILTLNVHGIARILLIKNK